MLRRLYDYVMNLAEHPRALWALAIVAFIESSVFPIPPDVMLIPMVIAARDKAWLIALVCTISSVLGGLLGYFIGFGLYDTVGLPVLDFYGYADKFEEFTALYNDNGAWIVFGAGITPFPYKVITIASGVTQLDLTTFMIASVAARGMRFFIVAGLLYFFGQPIRTFIEKYFGILSVLFFVLLLGGFVAIRYVF